MKERNRALRVMWPSSVREKVMKKMLRKLMQDESGASLLEYVLIAGVISVATIGAMVATNTNVQGIWQAITDAFAEAPTGTGG